MGIQRPDQYAMAKETGGAADEEKYSPLNEDEEQILAKMRDREERGVELEIDDFSDTYPVAEIEKDKESIKRQKKYDEYHITHRRASLLEFIVMDQAERSDWLGENCYTIKTTEYDDWRNHADFVVEWTENGQIYRLGIDLTCSESDNVLWEKEETLRREIKNGKLTKIKYFQSEADPETKGEIKQIPRAIIALDRQNIQKLCGDLIHKKPREMAQNPEQLLILEEIREQMSDQIEYALSLLLEEIGNIFKTLKKEERKELVVVLKEAQHLGQNPENLPKVLDTLEKQEKLLKRLRSYPSITKYLGVISQQKAIRTIADRLIEEKSGEVEKPAADVENRNIVLRRTKDHLADYHLPPQFQKLAEAA